MCHNFKKNRKLVSVVLAFLVIFISFSPILASKAEAQWVVWDPGNFVANATVAVNTTVTAANTSFGTLKEGGFDAIVAVLANIALERFTAATVNWINGGFRGSPAYITDPAAYFKNLGDGIAGQYIFNNPDLNFLCSPIQAKIKLALAKSYNRDNLRFQCTLSQVGRNLDNFVDDFSNGGWDSFFIVSQTPTENPIGAFLHAEAELANKIAAQANLKRDELNQGSGFLSFKTCKQWGSVVPQGQTQLGDDVGGAINQETGIPIDIRPDNPQDPQATAGLQRKCLREETSTPGAVISEQLNKTLGLGNDKLVAADEFNEIVSALLNQLVSKAIGAGRGLRGTSQTPSGGGETFANTLANRKPGDRVIGLFCFDQDANPSSPYYDTDPNICAFPESPNTDILESPPYVPPDCKNNRNSEQCQPAPGTTIGGGTTGSTSTVTPYDLDCAYSDQSTINSMAQTNYQSGQYSTYEDAMLNVDCPATWGTQN